MMHACRMLTSLCVDLLAAAVGTDEMGTAPLCSTLTLQCGTGPSGCQVVGILYPGLCGLEVVSAPSFTSWFLDWCCTHLLMCGY
jgi:hypothetical protein